MNKIQIFQNQEFGAIRTLSNEQGEPMFCAKDVAEALGYKLARKAVQDHVDRDDVLKRNLIDSLGRKQLTFFINESGLYSLIFSSKLESARRFKHWVTSEVLPSIRKNGGYMMGRPEESDEVIMARALQIMHATLQRRDELIAKTPTESQLCPSRVGEEPQLPILHSRWGADNKDFPRVAGTRTRLHPSISGS